MIEMLSSHYVNLLHNRHTLLEKNVYFRGSSAAVAMASRPQLGLLYF